MASKEDIENALRRVIDPEMGVNIVDLGLVYSALDDDGHVKVSMTMTSAACPMGDFLKSQAEGALKTAFREAKSVAVELTWDPPWSPEMMAHAAKKRFGGG
ncbi:MAG: metal-sulfur cluster assembly factor [Nitrospinae bacterium]|nr:metal-sulfur cluster assembly factor [Nitrospinota bacterium]